MRARYLFVLSLSFLFIQTFSSAVKADDIRWQTELKQAALQARTQEKAMLIQIGASWCGYCHKMDKETFQDQKVIKHVNSCFIPVRVDADKNPEFVEAIGVAGLPTTVIITPELKIVKKLSGYVAAREMQGHLKKICLVNHEQAGPTATRTAAIKKMSQKEETPEFAFKSVCLVSMLDEQQLVEGSPEFISEFKGRKLCFTSQEHKQKFDANPLNYWPAFDGQCRVSQRDQNRTVEGNPYAGGVYRGHLVFFSSEAERERFTSNPSFYLEQ